MVRWKWYEGPEGFCEAVRVPDRIEDRVAIASRIVDEGGWAETPILDRCLILGRGKARVTVRVGQWIVSGVEDGAFQAVHDDRFSRDYRLDEEDPRNRLPAVDERFRRSSDPDIRWLLGFVHDLLEGEKEDGWILARDNEIFHGVAVALKGEEPALTHWGSHDLADLAGQWRLRVEAAVNVGGPEVRAFLMPLLASGGLRAGVREAG